MVCNFKGNPLINAIRGLQFPTAALLCMIGCKFINAPARAISGGASMYTKAVGGDGAEVLGAFYARFSPPRFCVSLKAVTDVWWTDAIM